jgi:hypothetical protein
MPTTTTTPQTVSTIGARVRARLYMIRRFPGLSGRSGTVAGHWGDDLYVAWDGLPGVATMRPSHLMLADHQDLTT